MRKPVSIAAENGNFYALADDGTIWMTSNPRYASWERVLPLPQMPLPDYQAPLPVEPE